MAPTTGYTKLALIRDPVVPAGQTGPLHIECPCSTPKIHIPLGELAWTDGEVTCPSCGSIYEGGGWIIERNW